MKLNLFIILLSLMTSAYGTNKFQRQAGKYDCDEEARLCIYDTQNIDARTLETRIREALKPGDILTAEEGYIRANTTKTLSFWFNEGAEDLRSRFVLLLSLIDTLEGGQPSHLVQVVTEIYSISEENLKSLNARVAEARGSNDTDNDRRVNIQSVPGSFDLSLNVGSAFLNTIIGSQLAKNQIKRVKVISQTVSNLEQIEYSNLTNIYTAPVTTKAEVDQAGVTIGGRVSIVRDNPDLVFLENYNFRYGILTEATNPDDLDRVSVLSPGRTSMYLERGVSRILVSNEENEVTRGSDLAIVGAGVERGKSLNKLVVIVSAQAIAFEDYIQGLKHEKKFSLTREFSKKEFRKLPTKTDSVERVLEEVLPYSYQTKDGLNIVGIKLDKNFASQENVKKNIEIKIRGGGLRTDVTRSVENLMLSGLKFDDFRLKAKSKKYIKLKVRLREFRPGTRFGGWKKSTLYYDPNRNVFLN